MIMINYFYDGIILRNCIFSINYEFELTVTRHEYIYEEALVGFRVEESSLIL